MYIKTKKKKSSTHTRIPTHTNTHTHTNTGTDANNRNQSTIFVRITLKTPRHTHEHEINSYYIAHALTVLPAIITTSWKLCFLIEAITFLNGSTRIPKSAGFLSLYVALSLSLGSTGNLKDTENWFARSTNYTSPLSLRRFCCWVSGGHNRLFH